MAVTDSAIAIDGPGAVGKTTIGRLLAGRLGFLFIDTGRMYRALTWVAIEKGVDTANEGAMAALAQHLAIEFVIPDKGAPKGSERVLADGRDVTQDLNKPEVDRQVSLVSKYRGVREAMVLHQRELAAGRDAVMVGRDIGTVVLPEARLKIYLTASVEERARRRHLELGELGHWEQYSSILSDLRMRDKIDSERSFSPLKPADDAHLLDTDGVAIEEVVAQILELWSSTDRH